MQINYSYVFICKRRMYRPLCFSRRRLLWLSCMTERGMQLSDLSSSCEFLFPLTSISYFVSCTLGIVIEDKRKVFKKNRNIRNSKTSNHGRPSMRLNSWQTGFVVTFPSCGSWRHSSPNLRLRGEFSFLPQPYLRYTGAEITHSNYPGHYGP